MLSTTTPAPLPREPRRTSGLTKQREQQWRRDAFARGFLPLL